MLISAVTGSVHKRAVFILLCKTAYTVKIICKHIPYLGATELHPIWVNLNRDICVPG